MLGSSSLLLPILEEMSILESSSPLHLMGDEASLGPALRSPCLRRVEHPQVHLSSPLNLAVGPGRAAAAHGCAPRRQIDPSSGGLHHPERVRLQVLAVSPACPLPALPWGIDAFVLLSLELAGGPTQGDAGPGDAGWEHGFALRRALQPAQLPQAAPEGQSCHCHRYGAGTRGVLGLSGGSGAVRL